MLKQTRSLQKSWANSIKTLSKTSHRRNPTSSRAAPQPSCKLPNARRRQPSSAQKTAESTPAALFQMPPTQTFVRATHHLMAACSPPRYQYSAGLLLVGTSLLPAIGGNVCMILPCMLTTGGSSARASMNTHQLTEVVAGISSLAAFATIPCLVTISYRGWRRLRENLPSWRNFLGASSILFTLMNWLFLAYITFAIAAHRTLDLFTDDAGPVLALLVSAVAIVLSLALQGRPRVWAFLAATLMTALWTTSYLSGN